MNYREGRCAAALDTWTPDGSEPQNDPACQDGATSTEYESVRGCNLLNMSVLDKFFAHGSILKVAKPLEPRTTRPRVGHKKSRRGCHNCKRRKIKANLYLVVIEIDNPSARKPILLVKTPKNHAKLQFAGAIPYGNLQSTPTTFSLDDMLLFHHFLLHAHPHLPVGSSATWIRDVPLLAHHNPHLMHAMLALSASHLRGNSLSPSPNTQLYSSSLRHRIQAIRGLSEVLQSTGTFSLSHRESIQATSYVLLFQSCYLPDLSGFFEFLHFSRGFEILRRSYSSHSHTANLCFGDNGDHWTLMKSRLVDLPKVPREFVTGAETSLRILKEICGTCSVNLKLLEMLVDVTAALKNSSLLGKIFDIFICTSHSNTHSLAAYFRFVEIYLAISKMSNRTFAIFLDDRNKVARILMAHFLAIQILMKPILDRETVWDGSGVSIFRANERWIEAIVRDVGDRFGSLLDWPRTTVKWC
ncbi:C6 transcription factor protein [Rutstroemia sp. NJR-2017a BVV2]|nr:C6 transcription factor protein [Rutstroemia sp. NJR-2017a BVV2]